MTNITANSDFANLDIILEDLPGSARKPSRQLSPRRLKAGAKLFDAYLILRFRASYFLVFLCFDDLRDSSQYTTILL
jgi:hypothetical protein